MPITLFEKGAAEEKKPEASGTSIVAGTVVNDCDLLKQGKVLVRIPSLNQEVWARLSAPGGGSGAGLFYSPRADDEVLVALNQNDPADAFVLGGLWNNQDRPPVSSPVDVQTKRVLKTGLKGGIGHKVEFDDALQSIIITSSTDQKITIDPTKIELSNKAGTLKITLDNKTQTITIESPNIELKATATMKLSASTIDISAKSQVNVASNLACKITGKPVAIN